MASSLIGIPSVDALVKKLAATDKQIDSAMKRALAKTIKWAGLQGQWKISERLGISMGVMRGRVGVFIRPQDNIWKSWYGLNDLSSTRLHPKQTKTGAIMDGMKKEVPHAFVRSKNGKKMMFLRKQEKWLSGQRKGKQKLEHVKLPINSVGLDVIENEVNPEIEDHFLFEFERELQNQLSKQ